MRKLISMDHNLLKNDIINRYTVTSITEVVRGDGYTVTVVIMGLPPLSVWKMSLWGAYENLRYNLLNITHPCLPISTTIQRNALTDLEAGLQIYNTTSGGVETFDGTNWIDARMRDISCKVTIGNNQTIPHRDYHRLKWTLGIYDTDGMHDSRTNNDRITIKTAGKYLIIMQGGWNDSGVGIRFFRIVKNDRQIGAIHYRPMRNGYNVITAIDVLVAGDHIAVDVLQDSGFPLDFMAHPSTYFAVQKLA